MLSHRVSRAPYNRVVATLLAIVGFAIPAVHAAETAADASTRKLLDQLEERKMPDVVLWVLDRVTADPAASAELKSEVPFRRASALVALSRTEADSKKRAALYDQAQQQIDEFLKETPESRRAIDAYLQKSNLLIERARMRLEQAKRPGADAAGLKQEAVGFFDQAIKALEGTAKPDQEITQVTNAEDAVLKEWREAKKKVAAIKPPEPADDGKGGRRPARPPRGAAGELERLEADVEALQGKLVQTRIMAASVHFEKARAFDPKSKEWQATLEESTKQFKEIADKYPNLGGGVLSRYYEGRNLAELGKREQALTTLASLVVLDGTSPLEVMLRAKALTTSLECWLADKKFDAFDESMRAFALDARKVLRLASEPDRLALKYRAAELLKAQAEALPPNESNRRRQLLADAGKLAMEVARVNRDFADEAEKLVASLGKEVLNAADQGFTGAVAEAKVALAAFQEKQGEVKKLLDAGQDATAATAAAGTARDEALAKFDAALAQAEAGEKGDNAPDEQSVSYARYMRTYLLYDAKRYAEAADLGAMVVERFPNAMGSRQSGMIAVASLQQLAKAGDAEAKQKLEQVARAIAQTWPAEKEAGDALGVLVNLAVEARDPQKLIGLVDSLPANAGGRSMTLGRAGTVLWREVSEQSRAEESARPPAETIAAWKQKARTYLDEALAGPPGTGPALRVTAAAALARAQIALDEGDAAGALKFLEAPGVGPWTLVNDPNADAALREGSFAEATLTVALRSFIQAEQLDKAQQAMDRLEQLAGSGNSEEQSARLTNMYLSMGQQLQQQLERLGSENAADARDKAVAILGGFEKFLDGLAKRDQKVNSQIWVATTYLTLGSGKGTGAVVPKSKAAQYLDRAADVYAKLLARKDDAQVAQFEPSIRLKMASIYRERGKWAEAQEQIDWILSDAKRQNSLDAQVQAAEILQATAESLVATDAAAAEAKFREATTGRPEGPAVVWGWGGIASKVGRQAFAGEDEKSLKARELFLTARLNHAACLLARSQLPGKAADDSKALLSKAKEAVSLTRKTAPDLGGPAMLSGYEKLLKEIQKLQGATTPRGFAELDEPAADAPAQAN
jgi:hypothetical protein